VRQMSRASKKGALLHVAKGRVQKATFFQPQSISSNIACRITATTFCFQGELSVINSIVFKK